MAGFWDVAEKAAQVGSALAAAIAAFYAARSAGSASHSAKEMERARELSSAPLLIMEPTGERAGYFFDLWNGEGGATPQPVLRLKNLGNGPATNISVYFSLETDAPAPAAEALLLTVQDSLITRYACYVSKAGVRWDREPYDRIDEDVGGAGSAQIVALAKNEDVSIRLPTAVIGKWLVHAVGHVQGGNRKYVAHLDVAMTYDTMLARAKQQTIKFEIIAAELPTVNQRREAYFADRIRYDFTLSPVTASLAPRKRPAVSLFASLRRFAQSH